MAIIIEDLEINTELDKQAMISILGGWKNQGKYTSYSNLAIPHRISWANTGVHGQQHSLPGRARKKYFQY